MSRVLRRAPFSRNGRRRFITGAVAAGIAARAATARAAEIRLKSASDLPLDHPATVRLRQMWAEVERESNGRVHVDHFPNSSLGGDGAMLAQVRVGALQFFQASPGIFAAVIPAVDITNLGFAFRDSDEAFHVLDGPLGGYLKSEAAAKGLYGMRTFWDSGMRQITSSLRPIRTPDDFHGFKIRVVESRIIVDLFRTLGAGPTPMSFAETYTALQTKIVDGEDAPLVTIEGARFFEVQKFLSLTNHTWGGQWLVANGDAWKALSPDLQDLIERKNTQFGLLQRRDAKLLNASVGDKLTRQGLTPNRADQAPFRALLKPYYDTWSTFFGPSAWKMLQGSVSGKLG